MQGSDKIMKRMPIGSLVRYSKTYMNSWGKNYRDHWVGIIVEYQERFHQDGWYKVKWMQQGNVETHLARKELKYFRGKK